jgi:hypothetical protein
VRSGGLEDVCGHVTAKRRGGGGESGDREIEVAEHAGKIRYFKDMEMT